MLVHSVFPALKRLGQQDSKSEVSLGYIMRPISKTEVQRVLNIIKYISLCETRNVFKAIAHRTNKVESNYFQ